jgi:energy-converting hydrogenase A subunit P
VSVSYPEFRAPRCTRYRFRYSECQRCSDACPHDAIELTDSGAKLDSARCQNCALCVSACLTGAWAAEAFKPIDVLRQAIKQKEFSIACAPSGHAADAVVPCLGAIDAGMVAYLGKRRIPLTLYGSDHCGACAHGANGSAQLVLNLEAAAALCAAGEGVAVEAKWTEVATPAAEASTQRKVPLHAGRRQLFRRLVGRGVDAVAGSAAPLPPQTPIPDKAIRAGAYATTEQRELLQIVCERKDDQPFTMPWHEALPLMQLHLQPGCTTCEACFRACPTGAIQIVENPGDWALTFQADRCVGCAVCLEVCQPRVLDAEASFDCRPEQPARVLLSLVKQRCDRCDRFFVSPTPEHTCKVCSDDQDAFSAIFG